MARQVGTLILKLSFRPHLHDYHLIVGERGKGSQLEVVGLPYDVLKNYRMTVVVESLMDDYRETFQWILKDLKVKPFGAEPYIITYKHLLETHNYLNSGE